MFTQKLKDNINGWGLVFRFVTPILITVGLWIMSDMKNEIREIRTTAKEVALETAKYNVNHLEQHRKFESDIMQRITRLEVAIKDRLFVR